MLKLTSIDVQNFKSIHEARVDGLGDINVFFGPTNSGKTSLMESVYFQFNHQRLVDTKAYGEFLHSKADPANAVLRVTTEWRTVESVPNVNLRPGDTLRCVTQVTFSRRGPQVEETLFINNALEENADRQNAVFLHLRHAIKLSSSRRPGDSKRVYFANTDETPAERKRRFLVELQDLELQGGQYQEFLSRVQKLFPHLVYSMESKESILEFFGMGFLGTAKLLVYLFDARYTIVLIDEPEIHFYPSLTFRFVQILHDVVRSLGKQILLGTHATVFLHEKGLGSFYHMAKSKHYRTQVRQVEPGKLLEGLDIVNASPETVLTSDMVVYVEGPWDVAVLEEFIAKFDELKYVNIAVLQLGGGAMGNNNVDPTKLKLHNPLSFVIIDSERKSARGEPDPSHKAFQARCKEAKLYCLLLDRQAMENYFTGRALHAVFGDKVPASFANNPYKPLTKQGLGWFEKDRNREIAHAMTREELEACPDLKGFFAELIQVSRQVQ